ncbi:MAG: hypothetical protein Q4F31_07920 [Eubacteriales bacterium]|nr:hypothetical protein [Eubacteriales bacterium]
MSESKNKEIKELKELPDELLETISGGGGVRITDCPYGSDCTKNRSECTVYSLGYYHCPKFM